MFNWNFLAENPVDFCNYGRLIPFFIVRLVQKQRWVNDFFKHDQMIWIYFLTGYWLYSPDFIDDNFSGQHLHSSFKLK